VTGSVSINPGPFAWGERIGKRYNQMERQTDFDALTNTLENG